MENEKWGVGDQAKAKPFDQVLIGKELVDLIFGQYPHIRRDNNMYVRTKNGAITGFDGHRVCMGISIQEGNYMKDSYLSGDQIRKTCIGKLTANGEQIYECHHRNFEACYKMIDRFIMEMEELWWFLKKEERDKYIGKKVLYREQPFKIKSFIVEQGAMMLETIDGGPRKPFGWETKDEDYDEYELRDSVKVEITSSHIWWHVK